MTGTPAERRPRITTEAAGILGCLCVIVIGIALLDRPISTWVHAHLVGHRAAFDALTHIFDPLLPLSSVGLPATAVAALVGWRPGPRARVAITCAIAVVLVVTLKDQAKYAFGRLWPETWVENNPSWINGGSYGFVPFHQGRGWSSFPSGHMSMAAAPTSVLWRSTNRLKWIAALATVLVAIGLLGADYHFFSDIVAGTLMGYATGRGTLAVVSVRGRFSHAEAVPRPPALPARALGGDTGLTIAP